MNHLRYWRNSTLTSFRYITASQVEAVTHSESASYGKYLIERSKGLVRILSLSINQEVSPHSHKVAGHEYFYVIKGRGTLFAENEQAQVETGMMLSVPAEVQHGWKNITEEMLIVSILMPEAAYKEASEITAWKKT